MAELRMTYQQYIDNPMGKKNAVFSQRDKLKATYSEKYDRVMLREVGKIEYALWWDKKNDKYYCQMKVPSETVSGFYYDTVVEFSTTNPAQKTETHLRNYAVRFFANDPAFMYTYFYVFWKNGMFINELLDRFPRSARKAPDEKNPYQVPGYVKSLYFMYLHMQARGLFTKSVYHANAKPYNKLALKRTIRNAEAVLEERHRLEQDQKAQKRAEKREQSKIARDRTIGKIDQAAATRQSRFSKQVGKVKTTKTAPISRRTGTVRSTKKR